MERTFTVSSVLSSAMPIERSIPFFGSVRRRWLGRAVDAGARDVARGLVLAVARISWG
jgi:hypothetical protein